MAEERDLGMEYLERVTKPMVLTEEDEMVLSDLLRRAIKGDGDG